MENDLGEQPIKPLIQENQLSHGDLVSSSTENITFKMITKACIGRRLTPHVKEKILNALNKASSKQFKISDLFNY